MWREGLRVCGCSMLEKHPEPKPCRKGVSRTLPFFFSYFLPPPPLPLKFIFHFAPQSSQVFARWKLTEAAVVSPIDEASPRRDSRETSKPCALCSPFARLHRSTGWLLPGPWLCFTGSFFPFPPSVPTLQSQPWGHPVIRCPSDLFTFSVTADTSGAHIQVIPVPLDTFHKIISAVVMAIFFPPVIFKLHDRNSWS